MNANPADCDCERCEIDRERAPYQLARLRALREATTAQVSAALDAVESGSHRDSPAANGALLALTGLMLEQESKLSGAMVGRAARQQDQGEQSPMSAAETERRIGLMGRLNDAAARRRPQPAPEVADHDAELWYAACFACITSLQVVRQVRRQQARASARGAHGRSLPGGADPSGGERRGKPGNVLRTPLSPTSTTAWPTPERRCWRKRTPPSTRWRKPWRRICAHSTRTCRWKSGRPCWDCPRWSNGRPRW